MKRATRTAPAITLILLLVVSGASRAQDGAEVTNDAYAAAMIAIMQKSLDDLEQRVRRMESIRPEAQPPVFVPESLEQLIALLPLSPSREDVVGFLDSLRLLDERLADEASEAGEYLMYPRPEDEVWLAIIGREHLEVLLSRQGASLPEQWAIRELVTPDDRERVLAHLDANPALAEQVLALGWLAEAREILLARLDTGQWLPSPWVEAIVALEEPASYPRLVEAMLWAESPLAIYHAIEGLPDLDLDEPISTLWGRSVFEKGAGRLLLAGVALEHGVEDALRFALEWLVGAQPSDFAYDEVWGRVQEHVVPAADSPAEVQQRLVAGDLRFDGSRRIWRMD